MKCKMIFLVVFLFCLLFCKKKTTINHTDFLGGYDDSSLPSERQITLVLEDKSLKQILEAHAKTNGFITIYEMQKKLTVEISEEEFKSNAIFVFVNDQMCVNRITEGYGNPAVSYSVVNCNYVSSLNREGAENYYKVIKIFNKEKI